MRPLLFLDFDDVICLNRPYGGYDVASSERPPDLWKKLWHLPAVALLEEVVTSSRAHVVLTTSWLMLLQLEEAKTLFRLTDQSWLADALHEQGEALPVRGGTRLQAIDNWLAVHRRREPYAIVDDTLSGTGLTGSGHDREGRVVLCDVEVGLQPHHVLRLNHALSA
jgi:hypothetical protein